MSQNQRVIYRVEQGIAFVQLNRAEKHNALDMPMFYALKSVIKQVSRDKKVRVVIVSGKGESFCSGLDVKSVMHNRLDALKLLWKWTPGQANLAQQVVVGWRRLKVPVIMQLHGKCWGGGMQLALGGDFRIADSKTSLAIMESRWGLIPDMGGTIALAENLSIDQAKRLAMTAEAINAQQALDCGLITEINTDPLQAAKALAAQLIDRSPDTNYRIKKLYQSISGASERQVLARETLSQWRILVSKNQQIAVKRALGNKDIQFR